MMIRKPLGFFLSALLLAGCAGPGPRPLSPSPYDQSTATAASLADTTVAAMDAWRRAAPGNDSLVVRALRRHESSKSLGGALAFIGLGCAAVGLIMVVPDLGPDYGCDGDPACRTREERQRSHTAAGTAMVIGGLVSGVTGWVVAVSPSAEERDLRQAVRMKAGNVEALRIPRSKEKAPSLKKSSARGGPVPSSDPSLR